MVRRYLIIFLWFLGTALCLAQQQEKKLMERLMEAPDPTRLNSMNGKKFEGDLGSLNLDKTAQKNGSFQTTGKYSTGGKYSTSGFSESRSFLGIKNPWFGKKTLKTEGASLWTKSAMPHSGDTYKTESASVKKFQWVDNSAGMKKDAVPTRTYEGKGAAQEAVAKMDKKLTIDEVREILNKSH